jgi:hypothetical protein
MRFFAYPVVAAVLFACSEGNQSPADGDGGSSGGGATDASSGSGGGGTGGTGNAGQGGSGASAANGGGTGDAEPPLVDPDVNEACMEDPNPTSWSEESVSFEAVGARSVFAGAAIGGGVTLLAASILTSGLGAEPTGAVYGTVTAAGGSWTEPTQLSATPDFFDRPIVRLASDGSGGIVLWAEADSTVRYGTWSAETGWADSQRLVGPSSTTFSGIDAVALPGGHHVLAFGGALRVIESDGAQSADVALPDGLHRELFLGPGERPVVYVTSVLIAAGTSRYEYTLGGGFGAPETAPLTTTQASSWQEFWFEATTGIGARLIRHGAPDEGLYVTVRRGAQSYAEEERITDSTADSPAMPTVAVAGNELIVLWSEGAGIVERAHDGAWSAQRPLARSSSLDVRDIAGTTIGAGLIGTITLERVDVSKLFRRGEQGAWYCPRLARYGLTPTVTSEPSGELLFLGDEAGTARLVRFRP